MEAKNKKVYTFSKWGLKITAKNDIIAEIAKYVYLNNEGWTRPLPFMDIDVPDDIAKYIVKEENHDHFIFEGFNFDNYNMAIALQLLLLRHFKWCDNTKSPDNSCMTSLFKFHYIVMTNETFATALSWDFDDDCPIIPFLENYEVNIVDRNKFDAMKKKYNMDEDFLLSHADYL